MDAPKRWEVATLAWLLILFSGNTFATAQVSTDQWIRLENGLALPVPAPNGDQIPDFSAAGYGISGESLPRVAEMVRLSPLGPDQDRALIQAEINRVSALPADENGVRGAIVLSPGKFQLDGPLLIATSGVVIRGSGSVPDGTIIDYQGEPATVLNVSGAGRWRRNGPNRRIVDEYVPVGSTTVTLDTVDGLSAGDRVMVQRPFTADWISRVGMDQIPPKKSGTVKQWSPGAGLLMSRRIVGVHGTSVELDAPIVDAIRAGDGGRLWGYVFPEEISRVGIENLAIDATAAAPRNVVTFKDMLSRGLTAIRIDKASDVWVKDIQFRNFASFVTIDQYAQEITVQDVHGVNSLPVWWPVPTPAFNVDGQRVLIRRCSLRGDKMMLVATQSLAAGPIVFQDCKAFGGQISAGPHQRWAAGILIDNVSVPGRISVVNRGNMGTGQGWAGANVVIWNSSAGRGFAVASPPSAYTWVFGPEGRVTASDTAPAWVVSPEARVSPRSLFDSQVRAAGTRP